MKGSCALVASVLAASTVALSSSSASSSSSSGDRDVNHTQVQHFPHSSASSAEKGRTKNLGLKGSRVKDKFAPRFDGLRFIETLVTAHR